MTDQTEIRMTDRAENEILILRKVLPSDLDEVAQYRAEFLASGDSMDGCSNLRKYDDLAEWYRWIKPEHEHAEAPDLLPQRQSGFGQDHPVEWRRSGK